MPDIQALIKSLSELANHYSFQGSYAEAEPFCQEILALDKLELAKNNLIYINAFFQLAESKEKRGKLEEAESLYTDLLQKQEDLLGDESLAISPTLKHFAAFYCRQQKYALAETLYLRALSIEEYSIGACCAEINGTIDALINVFQKLGKRQLAEFMLKKQIAILITLHGENSLCVASCKLRLADLQIQTKQIDRAILNLTTGLYTYAKIFGKEAIPVLLLKNKLDKLRSPAEMQSFAPVKLEAYSDPYSQGAVDRRHPGNTAAVFDHIASH